MTVVPGGPAGTLALSSDRVGDVCAATCLVVAIGTTSAQMNSNIARPAPLRIRAV
ncbi:MAG: hypothetical protein ABSC35_14090 [Candidatus Dormibacteria bacterium]|jgi:hypothetical protein